MSNFKPCCHYRFGNLNKIKSYKSYALLKKELFNLIELNEDAVLSVYRSRRGEWGEWWEHWKLINGKPKIVAQGWS
jgi:hypothetical protein